MKWLRSIRILPIVAILAASTGVALGSPGLASAAEIRLSPTVSLAPQPTLGLVPQPTVDLVPRPVAGPPPGAIILGMVKNQWDYCVLLCPPMLKFAVNVSTATVRAPGVYSATLAQTGSDARAKGTALASVTGPASAGITDMFGHDILLVVPKVKNVWGVAAIETMNVIDTARSGGTPEQVGAAYDAGRTRLLAAVKTPMMLNPPDLTTPRTRAQAAAVNAVNIGWTVGYVVPEMMLIGGAATADKAANTLATTGNPDLARKAGAESFNQVLNAVGDVITDAVKNRRVPEPVTSAPPKKAARAGALSPASAGWSSAG
ncbi:hypothetical protein ACWDTI_24370 [Gordonia sp. NPDC003424]